MWMQRLLTAIAKSPKFTTGRVTNVQCYGCKKAMPLAEAYVDGKGYIWCRSCK